MDWLLLILGTCAAAETFVHLPFLARVRELGTLFPKTLRTLRSSRISDHWKEMVLVAYSGQLIKLSLGILVLILLILLPVVAVCFLGVVAGVPVLERFASVYGTVLSIGVAFAYFALRKRLST